jgi:predicted MPP superfamily phosphohydrolase
VLIVSTLVISDLHADVEALEAIISVATDARFAERYGKTRKILNLGDTVERGYHPQEVVETLRAIQQSIPVISLLGNHDEAFLYGWPVSGSDPDSRQAHARCRDCAPFLRTLPHLYLDAENRVIAVHGGPLDPQTLGDGWLFARSWQRIASTSYLDASGYHYTPNEAFRYVKAAYGGGYVILCGHEHEPVVFSDQAGNILDAMHLCETRFAGYDIMSRWIERDDATSYLIRVGIAGPEGYSKRVGLSRAHFGLMWRDKREQIGLFSLDRSSIL